MKIFLFFLLFCIILPANYASYSGQQFRFDYEWSEAAGGWLKFHAVPAVWDEARMRCHAEGAVLASPLTNELTNGIIDFVKTKTQHQDEYPEIIFTGVHATLSKGDYSSIEGVPLLRLAIAWSPGEPDNYDNSESCLVMLTNQNGSMADVNCNNVHRYVCWKKNTRLYLTECGTSDLEYLLDHRTGSCYKFHDQGLLWSQAFMTCMAEGGYLAIINDAAEATVVREIFAKHGEKTIFSNYKASLMIGFHDWGQRGRSFMTIHGQSLKQVYNSWSPGQPSSEWRGGQGKEHERVYGGNVFRNGLIDDIHTNIPLAFLCEKDPNSLR